MLLAQLTKMKLTRPSKSFMKKITPFPNMVYDLKIKCIFSLCLKKFVEWMKSYIETAEKNIPFISTYLLPGEVSVI